jgi:hypothetical protein
MGKIQNGVASEYEMPGETESYKTKSKLLVKNHGIPMPDVKPVKVNNDRICSTCTKEDVCMYKRNVLSFVDRIKGLNDSMNMIVDVDIRCKKWSGSFVNYR